MVMVDSFHFPRPGSVPQHSEELIMNATPNDPPTNCPDNHLCFYPYCGYGGQVIVKDPPKLGDPCVTLPEFLSVYNNSDTDIKIYDSNEGCWGDPVEVDGRRGKDCPDLRNKAYYSYKRIDD
jgi:hypothetical protein